MASLSAIPVRALSITVVSVLCASVAHSGPPTTGLPVAKPQPTVGSTISPKVVIPPNVPIKSSITLVLPVTGERPATGAQLVRTFAGAGRCAIGQECLIVGRGLGTHGLGSLPPSGVRLTFRPATPAGQKAGVPIGTRAADPNVTVTPTVWTPSLVGFRVPSTIAEGSYVIALRSTATGAPTVNELSVNFVNWRGPDYDGDGANDVTAGGDDCDDLDRGRGPGFPEVVDGNDTDEDCDLRTFGDRDVDGDGHKDAKACNIMLTGSGMDRSVMWLCGSDCDDGNNAIVPGAMTCDARDEATIFVCNGRSNAWNVDPRRTPVFGLFEPYDCARVAPPQGKCVAQPNGTAVCH